MLMLCLYYDVLCVLIDVDMVLVGMLWVFFVCFM